MEPSVRADAAPGDSITRLFTFGYGQTCPFTGKDLGDHYALVTAPDRSSALRTMLATFDRTWAFEYDPASPQIEDYIPRMTLHAHLAVGVPIEVPSPDPTGLTFGRDPEADPQPAAGRIPPHFESGRGAPFDEPVAPLRLVEGVAYCTVCGGETYHLRNCAAVDGRF